MANLELLTDTENLKKNGKDFSKWILSRSSIFNKRHRIPNDRKLYSLRRFTSFVKKREVLIRTRFNKLFAS